MATTTSDRERVQYRALEEDTMCAAFQVTAGERPDALRPCSRSPSHTIAKASEPMPLETGSTRVSVMAVAIAASTALPPSASIRSPACAASGCDVHTAFAARSGLRGQA